MTSKRTVRVTIDDRKFIVDFDEKGDAVRIKERNIYAEGEPFECFYNASYWSAKHHSIGSMDTLPARIISTARNLVVT